MSKPTIRFIEFSDHPVKQWAGEEYDGKIIQLPHVDPDTGKDMVHLCVNDDEIAEELEAEALHAELVRLGIPPNPYL